MVIHGKDIIILSGGTAICYMERVTDTKGNLAQGAYTFQGSGPLT